MSAKHRIRVYAAGVRVDGRRLWYTKCSCTWRPNTMIEGRYGRETWDAAFALGIAHLQLTSDRGR